MRTAAGISVLIQTAVTCPKTMVLRLTGVMRIPAKVPCSLADDIAVVPELMAAYRITMKNSKGIRPVAAVVKPLSDRSLPDGKTESVSVNTGELTAIDTPEVLRR